MKTRDLNLSIAWAFVGLSLTACADPCFDDGLFQGDGECAADEADESTGSSDAETGDAGDDATGTAGTDSGVEASCDDGVQNGDETDVDCGGSCAERCEDGEGCDVDEDCMSNTCGSQNTCEPSGETDGDTEGETDGDTDGESCEDGEQNGDETDVDCGNSCGATCEIGEGCDDADDCESGVCDPDTGRCGALEVTPYCADTDMDGFGDPDSCVDVANGETPPEGSVPNGDDCADDNADAYPGAAENEPKLCAEDEDEDGWGDATPPEGVDVGSDCSDADAGIFPGAAAMEPGLCAVDADEDGYGDVNPPAGVEAGTDCADDDMDIFPGAAALEPGLCAVDADEDGYGDANPPVGVDAGTDCVDDNADIFTGAAAMEPTLCTIDVDEDGYGSNSATDIDTGAENGTDCADDNINAFPGSSPNDSPTACMEDEDGDDFGDIAPPAGVVPGSDCDDTDVAPPTPFLILMDFGAAVSGFGVYPLQNGGSLDFSTGTQQTIEVDDQDPQSSVFNDEQNAGLNPLQFSVADVVHSLGTVDTGSNLSTYGKNLVQNADGTIQVYLGYLYDDSARVSNVLVVEPVVGTFDPSLTYTDVNAGLVGDGNMAYSCG